MSNETTKKALDEIINAVDDKINSRIDAMLARARARAKQSGASQKSTQNSSSSYKSKPSTVTRKDEKSNAGKAESGWKVKKVNRDCYILGSPELFGEMLIELKNEMWIKVNISEREGEYIKVRRGKTEGWINSSWINN